MESGFRTGRRDDPSSNEKPFAVLSSLKNASFLAAKSNVTANIEGGKSFPNDGLWGH